MLDISSAYSLLHESFHTTGTRMEMMTKDDDPLARRSSGQGCRSTIAFVFPYFPLPFLFCLVEDTRQASQQYSSSFVIDLLDLKSPPHPSCSCVPLTSKSVSGRELCKGRTAVQVCPIPAFTSDSCVFILSLSQLHSFLVLTCFFFPSLSHHRRYG